MRWETGVRRKGDERVRTFFAFLPVSIRNGPHCETRWLEWVTVLERCDEDGYGALVWDKVRFCGK